MVCPSLTPSEALRSLSDDIRAEDALIAGRVTWYVTSQAFLLTAHTTSWTYGFLWRSFFHLVLPLASVALSVLIFSSITAATWAQEVYLREQMRLVSEIRARLELSLPEALALDAYARTLVANRRSAAGWPVGSRIHAVVRITPIALPVGFALLWLYAFVCAPGVGP